MAQQENNTMNNDHYSSIDFERPTGRYMKVSGRVMYRQVDVKTFIEKRLHIHTGDIAHGGA